MMKPAKCLLGAVFAAGLVGSGVDGARAQSYPSRTVTVVNPMPAGGATDVICRLLAEKLRLTFGPAFVVENRTGAAGTIAGDFVARSAPDGHTLLCAPEFMFIARLLNPRLAYDPSALEPVSVHVRFPAVVTGRADLPVNNVHELIAHARRHPGQLSYASQGPGSMAHIAFEAIKMAANIELVHVPYRGGVPALTDLLGGRVDLYASPISGTYAHIKSGKLKALAVTTSARVGALSEVGTITEALPGLSIDTWNAFVAPPGTPKHVTRTLAQAIAKTLDLPDVRSRFAELQAEPFGSTPEEMAAIVNSYIKRMAPVIATAHITLN
jgi:tripartite-type tricarboxylate transporter receptor subunit TctC